MVNSSLLGVKLLQVVVVVVRSIGSFGSFGRFVFLLVYLDDEREEEGKFPK